MAALVAPLLLVVLTIGPALVGHGTLLSVSLLTRHMPWQAFQGIDAPGHQYCSTDTIDAVLPGTAYLRNQVFSGHLPNWQSLTSGGAAIGSNPDYAMLSPLSLPYWVLPLWLAPAFVKLLELVVGIGGMYLFLRRLDRSRLASSLAGMVFVTSGFMVVWSNWPQTRTAAWIPALFWTIERLLQRRRPGDVVLVAAVIASMLLAGFPAVTGYTLYLAAAYLLVRAIAVASGRRMHVARTLGLGGLALALGGTLAALQLLPFVHFIGTRDFSVRTGVGKVPLPFSGLLTTVAPTSYGSCINGVFSLGVNSVELIAFVGAAALTLAILTVSTVLWRRRGVQDRAAVSYFAAALAVVLLLGWGSTTVLGLASHLPIFSNNLIGRVRAELGFLVAVLAAYGLDLVLQGRSPAHRVTRPEKRRRAVAAGWFVSVWLVAILCCLEVTSTFGHTSRLASWQLLRTDALQIPVAIIAVTLLAATWAWRAGAWVRGAAAVLAVGLTLAQGVAFFHAFLPSNDLADFYPVTGAHRFLAAHEGHDRFDGSGGTLYSPTALYYGLRVATGHTFLTPSWSELLRSVDPRTRQSPTSYAFPASVTPQVVGSEPILDRMAVKYYAFDPGLLPGADAALRPGDASAPLPAGGQLSCDLPAQPLRGVQVRMVSAVRTASASGLTAHLTLTSGARIVTGARYLGPGVAAGTVVTIPMAAEDLTGSARLTLSLTGGTATASLATEAGQLLCQAVAPRPDHLSLVYSDAGTILFQRQSALARIRWASSARVLPTGNARLAALTAGVDPTTVVLASSAPAPSGKPASIVVTEDSGDVVQSIVTAAGNGYMVVADGLQVPGWSVTVDGKVGTLLPADHAMVAVAVPGGRHVVRLSFDPPGQRTGAAVTALALLLCGGLVAVDRRRWPSGEAPVKGPRGAGRCRPTRGPAPATCAGSLQR